MWLFAALTALATPAAAAPLRVMSLNLCTDQLVLALLPRGRIASVTFLSADPHASLLAARARGIPLNRGSAEEVLAARPDLVVAGTTSTPATRAMLRRLGYPLLEVAEPGDIPGIRRATRQVAAAVGARARGEALVAHLDRTLAALGRLPPLGVRAAAWGGDGISAPPGSLHAETLALAGLDNVARAGAASDVEGLLARRPALLVRATASGDGPSLRDAVARHPLVRRLWAGREIALPPAWYACGTPFIADGALRLRAAARRRPRA